MGNPDVSESGSGGGGKHARWLRILAAAGFSVAFVTHLLRGRWLTAAFFVASALLLLLGGRIEGWPRPRLYLAIAVYVALAVGMLAEVLWQVREVF